MIVNPSPTATLSGTQTICSGQTANLNIALTGTAPWTVVYNDGVSDKTQVINSSPFTLAVTPNSNTTYILKSVSDSKCNATGTVNGVSSDVTPTIVPDWEKV